MACTEVHRTIVLVCPTGMPGPPSWASVAPWRASVEGSEGGQQAEDAATVRGSGLTGTNACTNHCIRLKQNAPQVFGITTGENAHLQTRNLFN